MESSDDLEALSRSMTRPFATQSLPSPVSRDTISDWMRQRRPEGSVGSSWPVIARVGRSMPGSIC